MTLPTTKNRIIDAALGLVVNHGLNAVTMIDVARGAGIARATLYNHYPDVTSILADAVTRHNNQAISGLHQTLATIASPTEAVEQLVRYVAAISSHGHTLQAHHGFPPHLRDQISAFDDELETQIQRALTEGTTTGEFRPGPHPNTSTKLVHHMLNGVSELVSASPDTAAQVVGDATKMILAALGQRPS